MVLSRFLAPRVSVGVLTVGVVAALAACVSDTASGPAIVETPDAQVDAVALPAADAGIDNGLVDATLDVAIDTGLSDSAADSFAPDALVDAAMDIAPDAATDAAADADAAPPPACNILGAFGSPKPVYDSPDPNAAQLSAQAFRVAKKGARAYFFKPGATHITATDLTVATRVYLSSLPAPQIQPLAGAPARFDISEDEKEILITLHGPGFGIVSRPTTGQLFTNGFAATAFAPEQDPAAALQWVSSGSFFGASELLLTFFTASPTRIRTYNVLRVPATPIGAPLDLHGTVPDGNGYPTFDSFTAVRNTTEVLFARWGVDNAYARIYRISRTGPSGSWSQPTLVTVENLLIDATDHVVPFNVSEDGCTMYLGKGPIDGPFAVYQVSKPKN
jgi:hypothetical protein